MAESRGESIKRSPALIAADGHLGALLFAAISPRNRAVRAGGLAFGGVGAGNSF
jgi:hypothetical protein